MKDWQLKSSTRTYMFMKFNFSISYRIFLSEKFSKFFSFFIFLQHKISIFFPSWCDYPSAEQQNLIFRSCQHLCTTYLTTSFTTTLTTSLTTSFPSIPLCIFLFLYSFIHISLFYMYYLFNSNGRTASTILNIFIKPANDAPLIAVGFNSLQIAIKVFLLI